MRQITIEVEGEWLLAHRDDDEQPIAILESELSKIGGVEIKDVTVYGLTLVYDEQSTEQGKIEELVVRLLSERYPDDKLDEKVSFESSEVINEEKKDDEESSEESSGEKKVEQKEEKQKESEESDLLRAIRKQSKSLLGEDGEETKEKGDGKSAVEKIAELVGAAEFKALSNEIVSVAQEIKRTKTFDVFMHRCYLFSIGDGCGLESYLKLLSNLVSELGLAKTSDYAPRMISLGAYQESNEPFENALRAIEGSGPKNVRVISVDISEWMDKTETRYFKKFLRTVEDNADYNIVVFRVPFVDKDVLSKIKYSLSDLLSIRAVSFPPLSQEEIKACAEEELGKYGFTVTKPAWNYFFDRISEEKSDGKFYGMNTVKKVVRELIYQKHLSNAQKVEKSKQITALDSKALCSSVAVSNLSGMEQLEKLVGIDDIRKRVEEIIAQIELALKSGGERPSIHMRFVGNPGTGKTTVARIVGKILRDKGILRLGSFFEYSGRDFCGRYIGETAPKTAGICRDAYGSVLFIDEAYSLYRGEGDTKDFGREAIDTLIAEMENHRNDFVVIMAGYTDDIEKLMSGNLGLKSRMPYMIEFPNFTREQLYDIFVSMVKDKFKYDKGLFEAAHEFFINLPDSLISSKEFANARYVRNLFERTWAKAAMRCQLNSKPQVVLLREDFEQAKTDKEFAVNTPKKARIGF